VHTVHFLTLISVLSNSRLTHYTISGFAIHCGKIQNDDEVNDEIRTFVMFDARVMGGAERAEAKAEDISLVRTVTDQERAVRLVSKLRLCLIEPQCTPVPATLSHVHTLNINTGIATVNVCKRFL